MKMATGYESVDRGTGIELIRMGTMIPPPVHAMIMEMNLYEKGAFGPIALKTLQP
jgi:hypothetical protein